MSVLARLAGIERHVAAVIAAHTAPRLTAVQLAEQAGIAPDPWQIDVLTSRSPRILLNIARQAGKSTVSAVLAVHTALAEAVADAAPVRGVVQEVRLRLPHRRSAHPIGVGGGPHPHPGKRQPDRVAPGQRGHGARLFRRTPADH